MLAPLLPALRTWRAVRGAARTRAAARDLGRSGDGRSVCYVTDRFPAAPAGRDELAFGGAVKMTYLAERVPHSVRCRAMYMVSSVLHPHAQVLVGAARAAGIPVVLNQNGVYYRAWFGEGWEQRNEPLARLHTAADRVIYQSEFCRRGAERFLGRRGDHGHVIYNPVDLHRFTPVARSDPRAPVLFAVAAGLDRPYRMEVAVRTLSLVTRSLPEASLLIPGYDPRRARDAEMMKRVMSWARAGGVADRVTFAPPYTREQAPGLFQKAHVLLHPVYNDPCPNVVVEALACGLPVAFSASGGVPEQVGQSAGIGVPAPEDWDCLHPPDPGALADAVLTLVEDHDTFAEAARQRAVDAFGVDRFVELHSAVFDEVSG
jgi:glycosyltransferase involved in cell wall biosynthesis